MNVVQIKTSALTGAQIDVTQQSDIRYWTRVLGVTAHDLCLAVSAAGNLPADVRAEVRRRRKMFSPAKF